MKPVVKCNDNLDELRKIPDNSVDLVYIDPPFNTGKDWGDYNDQWKSMDHYLSFMNPRLKEIHRVLKPDGSLYLHVDSKADAYLRVMVDDIFGMDKFKTQVIWQRCAGHNGANGKSYGTITDTILFYTKGKDFTFNKQYIPHDHEKMKNRYNKIEPETGRVYSTTSLIKSGNSPKTLVFKDKGPVTLPEGKRYVWSQETYDKRVGENPHVIEWTSTGRPVVRNYIEENKGQIITNLWTGMSSSTLKKQEKRDYATQKPTQLLERIIRTSSNPGDVVLDAFAGSGTTCAVAKKLGRESICIDQNPRSCKIMEERLS